MSRSGIDDTDGILEAVWRDHSNTDFGGIKTSHCEGLCGSANDIVKYDCPPKSSGHVLKITYWLLSLWIWLRSLWIWPRSLWIWLRRYVVKAATHQYEVKVGSLQYVVKANSRQYVVKVDSCKGAVRRDHSNTDFGGIITSPAPGISGKVKR